MKETTRVAPDIDRAFEIAGFRREAGHSKGRKYYLCPTCSHTRTGYNRSAKCVGVNVDDMGLRSFCNHCNEEKVVMLEDAVKRGSSPAAQPQGRGQSLSERAMPRQSGYQPLHRAARANWIRR